MKTKAHNLEKAMESRLGKDVEITLTDNVRSMVSFRKSGPDRYVLRLHHMFQDAPEEILSDIALWMRNPRLKPESLGRFVSENRKCVKKPKARDQRSMELKPAGRYHDLSKIFAQVNAEHFDSRLEMRITWGRPARKRRPRHLRLGFFNTENQVITISPRLDRRDVPDYFVRYVVYHEMLHALLGVPQGPDGRRRIHPPEFKRLEKQYPQFERAMAFERKFFG